MEIHPDVHEKYLQFLQRKDGYISQAGLAAEPYAVLFAAAAVMLQREQDEQPNELPSIIVVTP